MAWILPILAAGGGLGAVALLASALREKEGEPAEPVPLPPFPASPGSSGIDVSTPLPSEAKEEGADNSAEVEALARVIASEAGSGTLAEQRAIGWTVRNRFRGKSIYDVEYPWREQKGVKPPFSSRQAPKETHRALARAILAADQSEDPTGGATSFFEFKLQDVAAKAAAMVRAGETGSRVIDGVKVSDITRFKHYDPKLDAEGLRQKWRPGSTLYANAGRFEFWGSTKLFAQRGGTVKTVVVGLGFSNFTIDDVNALAQVVEGAGGPDVTEQQAVAWAMRNRAARCGVTIGEAAEHLALVHPSTEWSRTVAGFVLQQPANEDPTSGAVDFWRPEAQRHGKALADACLALEAQGDVVGAAELASWRDYASEEEVRAAIADKGLVVVGFCGTLELLG